MTLVLLLHDRLAIAIVLYFAILGMWGVAAWRADRGPSPSYRGALVVAEAVALLDGVFGATLFLDHQPRELVHVLYGLSIVLAIPAGFVYARDRTPAQQSLVLGLVSLFAFGLAIRGITTG